MIVHLFAMNLQLAGPDKALSSFMSTKSVYLLAVNLPLACPDKDPGSFVSSMSAWLRIVLLGTLLQLLSSNAHHLSVTVESAVGSA